MFLKETDHLLVPGGTGAFDPNTTIFKQCPGLVKLVILLEKYIGLEVRKSPHWELPPDWLTIQSVFAVTFLPNNIRF